MLEAAIMMYIATSLIDLDCHSTSVVKEQLAIYGEPSRVAVSTRGDLWEMTWLDHESNEHTLRVWNQSRDDQYEICASRERNDPHDS